jgi:hypothetical protein
MYFIIKSNVKGQENWSGKGFSNLVPKVYHSFESVSDALSGYWFNEFAQSDTRVIKIVQISEYQKKLFEK